MVNYRLKIIFLVSLLITCIMCGYWMREFQRWAGSSNRKVSQQSHDSEIHDFHWHYQKLQRDMESRIFYVNWERMVALLRQEGNETDRNFRVQAGLAWMRTQNLVVVGTVRTAMRGLPDSLQNVNRLRALFNSSWIVIVESDSTDGTREYLYNMTQRDPSVRLLGCGKVNSREPCRPVVKYRSGKLHQPGWAMQRTREDVFDRGKVMAALRNQYLEYTYNHLEPLGATLMMAIDPDVTWKSWDLENIAQGVYYFKTKPALQQLCAHTCVFDRKQLFDPCSITFFNGRYFFGDMGSKDASYDNSVRDPPPSLPPLKLASCFQALSFYRLSDMKAGGILYGGTTNEWNCEHNTLAKKLSEVYIDPQMRLDVDQIFVG